MQAETRVLVVDDEPYVRDSLCEMLTAEGCLVTGTGSVREALEELGRRPIDVIVSDMRMPGGDVFELFGRPSCENVPVIVITGVGSIEEAVRAMKAGAFDFIQKPVDPEELLLLVVRACEHRRLRDEVVELRDEVHRLRNPRALVGSSPAITAIRERIAQVATTDAAVLVTGESGTGKELAAEEIHAASHRASRPLRRLHGGSLAPAEVAALRSMRPETLLVDEIGLLSPAAQSALLALLEHAAEADPNRIRLIATSNTDLDEAMRAGDLRQDLYWRLNVFPIAMPPLREHKEDIPELVEHFLMGSHPGMRRPLLTHEAAEVLGAYCWPGNVRELRNMAERASIVAGKGPIDLVLLRSILEPALSTPVRAQTEDSLHLRPSLDAAEKELVVRALERAEGVRKRAAYLLGIDARNLGYYLRKHDIV